MKNIFLIILLLSSLLLKANYFNLSGYVYDQENQPLPYVNIFVKNSDIATTADDKGRYFLELREGSYEIFFSMLGYEDRFLELTITEDLVKNVWMKESIEALNEVVVKVSKKDPAYDIIKKTIENKSKYIHQYDGISSNFYIKAFEKQKLVDSTRLKNIKEKNKDEETDSDMNLVEVNGKLYKEFPNHYKEIIDGYSVKGSDEELFFLTNTYADFNFYKNLIYSPLTEAPLISPLNWTALLSYRFRLLNTYKENGKDIYTIEVMPKSNGNALFEGEIDIVEGDWSIKKLSFSISKKVMNYYDDFQIQQEYTLMNDSLWILKKQKFNYSTKSGKVLFEGTTAVYYDSIIINPEFKKHFFGVEVGIKLEDAYEKDSSYWNLTRPEPLSVEEQMHVVYVDSVNGVLESDWYKDSVQKETNKITIPNILWFGQDYVKWRKKKTMYFAPMANMFDPISPGGFRVGYYAVYYKKFENKRSLRLIPNATYGVRNEDFKGTLSTRWVYDPYHLRQVYGYGGRQF